MNCEIEFLPVGDGSKPGDAIVVRYGEANSNELMVVDGGNSDSGKALVEHIRTEFGKDKEISHVVLTHCDADHASGLREVLSELPVKNLWLHIPWAHAAAARPYFANKNWTDDGLALALYKEYDLVAELVNLAFEKKTIRVCQPFAGMAIGPFHVLSPWERGYPFLLPQFDRTPDPDQPAIKAAGWWIGKAPGFAANILEKTFAKVQKWVKESWDKELLKDGGVTSASNETSVVLYGDFGIGRRVLLTGDAGTWGLTMAALHAEQNGLPLKDFMFVQIPHHGSRRNVGPSILNRLVGPIQAESAGPRYSAFVSAPKNDDTHPRKMVINAFIRRGAKVCATQGANKCFPGGFPLRPNYGPADLMPFATQVEEYDD
jgi:beta-lactamase superfamily II metal-dependent hydrolase